MDSDDEDDSSDENQSEKASHQNEPTPSDKHTTTVRNQFSAEDKINVESLPANIKDNFPERQRKGSEKDSK